MIIQIHENKRIIRMEKTIPNETSEPKDTKSRVASNVFRRLLAMPEVGILIPLVGFSIVFYILDPIFLSNANVTTMLRAMSFVGVIAIGQTLLMISGAFDLSVGSTAGLAAIVCSYAMVNLNLPIPVAFLAGLGVGVLVGLINSFSVLKLGVPAFIATLGMLYIAKGITFLISKGYTIYPLPEAIKTFGTAEPFNTSWSFVIFIILGVIAHIVLSKTTFGRKLYAVGGNPEVARLAGINPAKIQMTGFIVVGLSAALSGMLLMSRIVTGNPTTGLGWEMNVISGVVIGGVSLFGGSGSIPGAFLGLLLMQVVTNGLVVVNVDPYWQTVSIGIIMIIAVAIDVMRRKSKTASS
jgi:ribose transport system permease protein